MLQMCLGGESIRSESTRLAHEVGAIMVVVGQSAPPVAIDVQDLEAKDFFAFSGHKMAAPTGLVSSMGRKKS